MNLKKNKHFLVICVVSILCLVACEAVKGALDNDLTSDLAGKIGVDGSTLNNVKTGVDVSESGFAAVTNAISSMSLEDERILGETVGVQLYSTPGFGEPINNKELMLFMNTMANVIAQNSVRSEIPYHVAVVRSDEKNAYALPGGYIFVTTGLILSLQNEAQLAVVLGHEIAHIAKKHTLNEMKDSKTLGSLIDVGSSLTKAAFGNNMGVFTDFIKDLGKNIAAHSFSKTLEIEADTEGVQYAYDTGYDPRAILGVLDILQAKDAQVSGDHATTSDRRSEFQNKLQEFEGVDDLVTSTGRLEKVKQWIQNDQGW